MKNFLVFVAGIVLLCAASGGDPLKVRSTLSPNLLKNANFDRLTSRGEPADWVFDNCSRSPEFRSKVIPHPDGNIMAIDAGWIQFGYWLQNVPVKEGKTYYASCEYQSDAPSPMLWLQCKEYYDGGSPLGHYPVSKTKFYMFSYLRHGEDLSKVLTDFVDPELVCGISSDRWTMYSCEFTVPEGKGCKNYEVRMGIYGGNAGQARYRRVIFRKAAVKLEVEVSGKGWKQLNIPGAVPGSVKVDPAKPSQFFTFILPSSKEIYKAELLNTDGSKFIRRISHE